MAIDIRVVDASTSRIVAATSVQGEATDVNMGAALLGASGGGALGGSLAAWQNTPIEKALRICINEAVNFIVSKTPQTFYRHGGTTMAAASPPPAPTAPVPAAPAKREVPDYQPGMVAQVSSSRLNVRSGPGTAHGVAFVLHQSDPVLVLDKSGQWIQVKDQQQRTGWTAAWLTNPAQTISPEIFEGASPAPAATPAAAVVPGNATAAQAETTDLGGPMARLKRVEMLRKQNLISEDEYQTARAKILAEL